MVQEPGPVQENMEETGPKGMYYNGSEIWSCSREPGVNTKLNRTKSLNNMVHINGFSCWGKLMNLSGKKRLSLCGENVNQK